MGRRGRGRAPEPDVDPFTPRGGTYAPGDGFVDPPRNARVLARDAARRASSSGSARRLLGLERSSAGDAIGVETSAGAIATERVLLTGGPTLREVEASSAARFFVGAVRHQVAVTEPHEAFDVERQPMVFENAVGLYWRLEEGGLLFGMSNPDEAPGPAREVDWPYLREMEARVRRYVPIAKDLDPQGMGRHRSSTARTICRWSGRSGRATARRSRA